MKRVRKVALRRPVLVLLAASLCITACQRSSSTKANLVSETALGPAESDSLTRFAPVYHVRAPAAVNVRAKISATASMSDGDAKQVIHTAELSLVVQNVSESLDKLRRLTAEQKGEVDQSRQWSLSEHTREGAITVRVPSSQLDATIKRFETLAIRVTNEQFVANDVTRQYTDNAARLHSLQAEEQQYLAILKQAKSVQDILDVTDKLTDVRTSIEQLQGEINTMEHDVAMSAITISLTQNAPETADFNTWHPLVNFKRSAREMISALGDWADSMISLLVYLPVIALWVFTFGLAIWLAWKLLRFVWRHRRPVHA